MGWQKNLNSFVQIYRRFDCNELFNAILRPIMVSTQEATRFQDTAPVQSIELYHVLKP